MSDTGLNIKLYADDKEFKRSLKDLESEAKRSGQAFKTFSEQAKNLKGADKVNATTNALKALENELNATTSKAQLLKNKLNEVGNDSKLGKSSEQYKQLQRELTATENKAQILKGKIAEIGSGAGGAGGVLGGLQGTLEKFGLSADGAAVAAGNLAAKGFGLLAEGAIKGAEALAKATIEAVKITAAFDSSLSAIQAFSGGTEADLAAIRETALELSSATKYTATEVSDSMQVLAKAGWDTSDIQNGMKGVLDTATASGESVETAAAVIVQSLNSFGAGADQAAHFGDVLTTSANSAYLSVSELGESMKYVGPLAGSMGLSLEDVNTALVALAENGIRGGQAGNVLRSFISRLSADTDGALEKFKQLTGESAFDSSGNLKSLTTIFNSLRTAMSGYTAQEQAVIAKNLAGERGFSGLLAILNKSEDAYESLNKTIENSTGATARANDTMMDNLQGDIDILKSNIEKLQIDWGSMFTPMLRGLTQFATGAVQAVDSIFDDGIDTELLKDVNSISEEIETTFKDISKLELQLDFPDLNTETKEFKRNADLLSKYAGRSWDSLSGVEQTDLKKALDNLSGAYPPLTKYMDEATGAINLQGSGFQDALKDAKAYYEYIQQQTTVGAIQQKIGNLEGEKVILESEKEHADQIVEVWNNLGKEKTFQGYIDGINDFRSRILPSEQEKLDKDLADAFYNAKVYMSDILKDGKIDTAELSSDAWNVVNEIEKSFETAADKVDFYSLIFKSIGKDGTIDQSVISEVAAMAGKYSTEVWTQVAQAFVGHDNMFIDAMGLSPDFIKEYEEASSTAADGIKTIVDQQDALQAKVDKSTEALKQQEAAYTALEKADARIAVSENGLTKKDGIIEEISYIDELAKKYKTTSDQINKDLRNREQGKATQFVTEADIVWLDQAAAKTRSLTEEYKKQAGVTQSVVDGEEDIASATEDATNATDEATKAQEKLAEAIEKTHSAEAKFAQTKNAMQFAKGWTDALDKAKKSYDDYIEKVTKSLAWDSTKEYKPIGYGDDGYVTFEQRNKNLEDYNKHQQERLDLLKKQLPEIEKISPTYAKAIYDAMASGDEAAIQGFYENIRNTLDLQGEQTLEELAAHFEEEQQKMQQLNHEMAVMAANFNKEQFNAMLSGQMTQEERGSYGAKLEDILGLGGITQEDVDRVNGLIDAIQAAGGDLSETTLSILNNTEGWETDSSKMFEALINSLESEGEVTVQELAELGGKLGYDMSENLQQNLKEALNAGDTEQVQALLQEWANTAGFTVEFNADGTLTINKDPEAVQKAEEVQAGTLADIGAALSGDDTKVETKIGLQTTVVPEKTDTETTVEATKTVNTTEKVTLTNAGEADKVAKEDAEKTIDVDKVVNVKLIPNIKNAGDVDTEANSAASKTTTTTQTENVNRKININASIKTNISGDSGSDVGEEFGKGIASGIQSQAGSISGTANSVMSAAAASAGSGAYGKGSAIGGYFGSGMAAGINSQVGAVAAAAARLEAEAERVVRAKAKISSPSKVMEQMGIYWGEGFAVGIDKSTSEVIAASDKIMDSLINATASPDAATSAAKTFANSYATSLSKELEKEIKKDKKSAIEAITDAFNSNNDSKSRASAALKAANATSRTSADFKEANKKEADEWKEKASDLQKKIDDNQAKIDKAKKKNASKKDKKAAKEAKTKIAEQKKQQEEYLKYAYIAAQEEARIEAERSRIDSAISSVDTNATLRENKLIVDNKGKELDVTQKLQLAEQKRTEALKVLNAVNANADATTEQKIDAYNTYADSVKAAAEAHQALADSILNEVSTASAWAKAQQTISNGGAPLSAAQELSIAVNQLSAAKKAQKAIEEDIYATEEQRLSAAQALADAYTEQYNAQRKINQELINSISTYYSEIETRAKYEQKKYGEQDTQTQIAWTEAALINARNKMLQLERNRNTLQSEYIAGAKETVALEEQLLNLKKQEQQELINNPQEGLSDAKLNIDIVSENGIREIQYALDKAIKNYNYLKFNAVSEDLVKSAKQTVKSLEDELSSTIVSLIDADLKAIEDWQTHYEAYWERELNNAEKVTKAEKALASLQERKNWLIQNELYTGEAQLKIEKELVTLTKERNEAQKAANKDLMDSVSRQLDWYETYLKYSTRKAITEQQRVELAERELQKITDAYYKIQENAPTGEENLEYLKKVVEAQEEYNNAVEAFNKKIISDSTKKTDEWRTRTEYAQKRALNNYQEIEYATRKLEEVQNAYNLLRLKGTLSLEDELEMMNKITSASQELNNAYKSLYKNLTKNLTLDKPFTAAEANIKVAIENMESHITGLNDLMSARAAVEARGLSDLAKSYLNGLSAEESANLYIELQNATEEDFKKFNDTLTEYALKDKQYSDLQQEQEEILVDHVTNIAQAVNQISTNGIQISSSNMGIHNAGIATQQNTQSTAALERSMSSIVTAMLGMSNKFDQMSGDMVATMNDFSQEVTQALSKVGISIDGREFGRIVRQYA